MMGRQSSMMMGSQSSMTMGLSELNDDGSIRAQ